MWLACSSRKGKSPINCLSYHPEGKVRWIPAKNTLASLPFPLKNQIRVEMLREGRRENDGPLGDRHARACPGEAGVQEAGIQESVECSAKSHRHPGVL
jgi:hypothetical protein